MTTVRERALNASRVAREKALARGPSRSAKIAADPEMQRVYWVWCAMRSRCHSQKDKAYYNYGARGITVCDEWRVSFDAFVKDMGPRPTAESMLERINNDSGYSPSNCRWATRQEQNLNKRTYRNSPTGERCIEPAGNGSFRVRIRRGGKIIFHGRFRSIDAAIATRDKIIRESAHATAQR